MILTAEELEILDDCLSGRTSNQKIKDHFEGKVDSALFDQLINISISKQNPNDLARIFNLGGVLGLLKQNPSYSNKLLQLNWHWEHEEMVYDLQLNQDVAFIGTLVNLINHPPPYLSGTDLRESFLRKCFYALAAQPQPHSRQVLKQLSESDDPLIKEISTKFLNINRKS